MMTDERIAEDDLLRAAARMPRGSGIVLRHHATPEAQRRALFARLGRIARRRHLILFVAGDARMAAGWGADGHHGGSESGGKLPRSMAVHDMRQLRAAERGAADLVFLSPLFPTRSHPGARPLRPYRFAALARRARMPVMALGGVAAHHAGLVRTLGADGWAAIDAFTRPATARPVRRA